MLVYTSITKSYLPKARVLAKSVKRFHPDWIFVLLFSDTLPGNFDLSKEPFDEIVMLNDLDIPNLKSWVFGHSVVELCTAVKGPAAELLAKRKSVDKLMYLDPDIRVFNSLSHLEDLLDQYDILLTPHLLDVEEDLDSIQDNEISALKHGVYNLGFFAAKTSGQGLDFIHWWAKRLRNFCWDDIPAGLFTDQRWCDLAPAFFSKLHIIRDRGFNVATWNIAHRPISRDNNGILISGDVPLRFYHFTGYDSGDGMSILMKYAKNQPIALELWMEYRADLLLEGNGSPIYRGWEYSVFDNQAPIDKMMRKLYRSRVDLQMAFPNPYSVEDPSFLAWWGAEHTHLSGATEVIKNQSTPAIFKQVIKNLSSVREIRRLVSKANEIRMQEGLSGVLRRLKARI